MSDNESVEQSSFVLATNPSVKKKNLFCFSYNSKQMAGEGEGLF